MSLVRKFSIIDPKIIDIHQRIIQPLNLYVNNGSIFGTGYVPDEEDGLIINAKNAWFIPDFSCPFITESTLLSESLPNRLLIHGFNRLCVASSRIDTEFDTELRVDRILDVSNEPPLDPEYLDECIGVVGVSIQNPTYLQSLFEMVKDRQISLILDHTGSELFYLLQSAHQYGIHCVVLLQSMDLDLECVSGLLGRGHSIQSVIPIQLANQHVSHTQQAIRNQWIHHFIPDFSHLETYLSDVFQLVNKNPQTFFNCLSFNPGQRNEEIAQPQIHIGAKPTGSIIAEPSTDYPFECIGVVREGAIVYVDHSKQQPFDYESTTQSE